MIIVAIISESLNIRRARLDGLETIPWNWFNRLRLLITFSLIVLKALEICAHIYSFLFEEDDTSAKVGENNVMVISSLLAPIIEASCYSILLAIYFHHRKAGIHTSVSIWFYLFLSVLCDSLDFYSLVSSIKTADYNDVEFVLDYIHYPVIVILFLLECRSDTLVIQPNRADTRPESPELQASFFSTIILWWFNGFIMMGYRSRLHLGNLWKTLHRDETSRLVPMFRSAWLSTKGYKCSKSYQTASGAMQKFNHIMLVLIKLYWTQLLFAAFLKLLQDSLQFVTPMLLKQLIAFMKSSSEPLWHGVFFALLMLILPTVQSLLLMRYFYYMGVIGFQIRSMLVGTIYRKALLLSGSSRLQSTSGEIVNLMAVDSYRFQDLVIYVNLIWSAPFQMILAISLLYRELGWSVFAGVACMALVLPANAYLANRIKFSQVKVMKTKDQRVKQMNELLNGVKVVKLYAWENSFLKNLISFRDKELEYLKRILTLDAVQTFLWQCSPFVVALVSFAVYVNVDDANVLDAEKAFVSISLFNLLRFPLTMLPNLVTTLVLTMVSARRLNKFLNSNELVKYVTRNEELEAIAIEGGSVAWSSDNDDEKEHKSSSRLILRDINLHIKPKSFVAVIGPVAGGKSSLLASILGEMHRISGRFNVCKSMTMAYVPQQAWIQNMTVRDNILFGQPYNETRFKRVLSDCSLQADLDMLPGGDMAEIGEKGINLSGGQKQRVSLARACYSNSDIYLIDDPLSALDSHVAKHVFDKVLSSSSGLLRNKTRVLATNSLFVLPHVDHIVVLDEGRIVESGSYKELMAKEHGYLAETMRLHSGTHENDQEKPAQSTEEGTSSLEQPAILSDEKTLKSMVPSVEAGKLIDVEHLETGSVNYRVYLRYFKAVSHVWLLVIIGSLVLASAFNVATNLWLSIWSSDSEHPKNSSDTSLRTFRLVVYATLGGVQCLSVLTGSLGLSKGAVRASRQLHTSLLVRVLHSPMTFFDTTPIGRIVNRFAKDIDVVDATIPGTLRSWINCLLQVLSTMFVICFSFPTFFVILVPLAIFYYLIQKIFIVTTRQLKRLESNTRSPIYSHFSETLSGINSIRAYDCVDRFVNTSQELVDHNQSCAYPNVIANRWLSVRLEFFGNLITASAAMFSAYYKGAIGAGIAGLTISYSLNITQTLSWFVRMTSDLETHIVSVERILEYMRNKQEDHWIKPERPPPEWPQEGAIRIQNYSTRYREDTSLVLKNLTINIKPREKVGIVGRTGSGKSSLSLSLFRILDPVTGSIFIDELDIMRIGLHDLRSKLTIIPQDPVLFSGTLRFNLDPLKLKTDTEIWKAVELAHLKAQVNALPGGLDHEVCEFGENFSVGQRQLICLARAILRRSKVICLDEMSSALDLDSDRTVQATIREEFKDSTIITIAHRLNTIQDYDRVIVMENGSLIEDGTPKELLKNPESRFHNMAIDAGLIK